MTTSALSQEIKATAERVGDFIEYWGFKHAEGRIWAVLFLSSEPRDMGYLINQLGLSKALVSKALVSKALVSMAISRLIQYDVVKAVHPDRQRYQTYEANPNVLEVIFNVLRSRERQMLSRVASAARELDHLPASILKEHGFSTVRIKFLLQMVKVAAGLLDSTMALKAWDLGLLKNVIFAPK